MSAITAVTFTHSLARKEAFRNEVSPLKWKYAPPIPVESRASSTPLPYSPLFFIPFTWLPNDVHLVEDALKHVALVLGAAEAIVIYWLATFLLGARVGVTATLLAVFLPPML